MISALAIVAIGLTLGCSPPESWTSSVYPSRDNLQDSVSLGSFPSQIRCAAAAIDVLDRMGALARGDYECGLRCKRNEKIPALFICEKTEKPIDPSFLLPGVPALQSLHKQCMARVASVHRHDFLTYQHKLKAMLGLGDPDERRSYAAFVAAVDCVRSWPP